MGAVAWPRWALWPVLWWSAQCATTSLKFRRELEAFFGALPYEDGVALSRPVADRYEGCVDRFGAMSWTRAALGEEEPCLLRRPSAPVSPYTVLELGIHKGGTTVALSVIFHRVIAVDVDTTWITRSREKQDKMAGLPNVVFLTMDLYGDNWMSLQSNQIEVVFIDAAHDYPSVKSDTLNALQIDGVQWLIFHDYHETNDEFGIVQGMQTREVVDEFVAFGLLDCGPGSPPPLAKPPSGGGIGAVSTEGLPEAVICKVLQRWQWNASSAPVAWQVSSLNNRRHSKLSRRMWHFYRFEHGNLETSRLGGPQAVCQVLLGRLLCDGEIKGKGYVLAATDGGDARTQEWYIYDGPKFGRLRAYVNKGFTSLHGHYQSGHFWRDYIAISGDTQRSFMRKEIDSLSQGGIINCCPGDQLFAKSADHTRCAETAAEWTDTAQFGVAEACVNRGRVQCACLTACRELGAQPFRATFSLEQWAGDFLARVSELAEAGGASAKSKAFYESLVASKPVQTLHAELCLPCRRSPPQPALDQIFYSLAIVWVNQNRPGIMKGFAGRGYQEPYRNISFFGELWPARRSASRNATQLV